MPIAIRAARPADVDAIAELHAESWRTAYRGVLSDVFLDGEVGTNRRDLWRGRFRDPSPNQHVWVAEDGDDVVGFICIFAGEDPRWGSLVDNLHVSPARRGGGIGEELMRVAGRWLAEHGPGAGVYLWVYEANQQARRFYERLGGSLVECEMQDTADGGTASACRYVWTGPAAIGR